MNVVTEILFLSTLWDLYFVEYALATNTTLVYRRGEQAVESSSGLPRLAQIHG